MQPGDLVPTFTGLASLAGQIEDFDSATLNGIYTVLVFYEVPSPNPLLSILHILVILIIVHVQGDFQPVSASFLRALASSLEGKECHIVAISTDSIEAHRFTQCSMFPNPSYLVFHFSEFAATSLKGLSIPLVEDKTGEISRSFAVFDPTTHTAVPTAFILDEEGELMASFSTSTKVFESNLEHFLLWPKVGGSAEEVARVVAGCRECDSSGAWSHQSKGTPVCRSPKYQP